jgi:hypothetical protein
LLMELLEQAKHLLCLAITKILESCFRQCKKSLEFRNKCLKIEIIKSESAFLKFTTRISEI